MRRERRITREYLEYQSDQLESVLAVHRVPSRVSGGAVSPRWVRFNVQPNARARVASVRRLREEIAMALGSDDVRITRDGGQIAVEVPRPDPQPVMLLHMLRQMPPPQPLTACLGMAEDGRPLLMRLTSPDVAHVLVAGTTGSGKTELLRALVMSLAINNRQSRMQLLLIDPKGRGLAPLGGLPHLIAPVVSQTEAAIEWLDAMVDEMVWRDEERISDPRIVIVIDEVVELMMLGGKTAVDALVRLAQRGREAGLHLVLGAQKPASSVFDGQLKANMPVRLVGRMASAQDALVAAGVAQSGAEKLLGRGDFLAVASGTVTRFQAAYMPARDWPVLERAAQRGLRALRRA